MTNRQLIMGSPENGGDAGANTTYTITASEPGVLHLDSLVLQIGYVEATNTPSPDLTPFGSITSMLVYNAIELLRGRNTPVGPAGALSGYRGINALRMGDWKVQAGDTFALTFDDDSVNGNSTRGSIAAAFSPAMRRGGVAEPTGPSTYAASPVVDLAAGGVGTATLTFDEDGVFSLSSIQSRVMMDLVADGAAATGPWIDASPITQITSITLPTGNAVVIGQNTPVCPATFFSAGLRSYSFAELGAISVSAGDTLAIAYDYDDTDVGATASFGGRFYPAAPVARGGRC